LFDPFATDSYSSIDPDLNPSGSVFEDTPAFARMVFTDDNVLIDSIDYLKARGYYNPYEDASLSDFGVRDVLIR